MLKFVYQVTDLGNYFRYKKKKKTCMILEILKFVISNEFLYFYLVFVSRLSDFIIQYFHKIGNNQLMLVMFSEYIYDKYIVEISTSVFIRNIYNNVFAVVILHNLRAYIYIYIYLIIEIYFSILDCHKLLKKKCKVKWSEYNVAKKKKKKVSWTNIRKFEWWVGEKKYVGVISKKSCFTIKKIFNEAVNVNLEKLETWKQQK